MRKNRTAKFIFNGALLAVAAVLGVTAYQSASKKEHIQEVLPLESTKEENLAETDGGENADSLAEAGTNLVEADMDGVAGNEILNGNSIDSAARIVWMRCQVRQMQATPELIIQRILVRAPV